MRRPSLRHGTHQQIPPDAPVPAGRRRDTAGVADSDHPAGELLAAGEFVSPGPGPGCGRRSSAPARRNPFGVPPKGQLLTRPAADQFEQLRREYAGRWQPPACLARGYEHIDRKTGQIYGTVLRQVGREPRPPLTWETIGTILQGLAEGLGLRHKIDPAAVQGRSESAPGLYATAVAAVLAVLTRPSGDESDTTEAIEALLRSVPTTTNHHE